jgi:hypothetical protein
VLQLERAPGHRLALLPPRPPRAAQAAAAANPGRRETDRVRKEPRVTGPPQIESTGGGGGYSPERTERRPRRRGKWGRGEEGRGLVVGEE